jgi:hypothetical protein
MPHFSAALHPDLLNAQERAYKPSGLIIKNVIKEMESQEYGACEFTIGHRRVKFRVAKIMPTKVGQFVAFWKRIGRGPIIPYDMSDQFDFLVVTVRDAHHCGQFVFPKNVLYEKGFVSKEGKGGKRAMRVYPPWDVAKNRQAKKTQVWQCSYFFEILPNTDIDTARVKELYCLKKPFSYFLDKSFGSIVFLSLSNVSLQLRYTLAMFGYWSAILRLCSINFCLMESSRLKESVANGCGLTSMRFSNKKHCKTVDSFSRSSRAV